MREEQTQDNNEIAIRVEGVSKVFKLPHEKNTSIKSAFVHFYRRRKYEQLQALKDVSFEIKKGEFFGIVGRNGSGKSTLLKLLAGIYTPTKGSIHVNGSLTPFIELGVGFNKELTGRENIFLNGALLGFNRKEMQAMYKGIVEFAELEKFMDQKLKNYSSGMQVRLAFSIAIRAQGDILLLDEVLAVGDVLFQQKCFDYFHKIKQSKRTVLLVSHDTNVLRQYCTRGVLLESGELVDTGSIDKILNTYVDIVSKKEIDDFTSTQGNVRLQNERRGTGRVLVRHLTTLDKSRKPKKVFDEKDKTIVIRAECEAIKNVESPVYGIVVKDTSGATIFSSNNLWSFRKSHYLTKGLKQKITWTIPNIFNTGEFFVSPAIADSYGKETYDWVDDMATFKVRKKSISSALTNPPHDIDIPRPESG